MAPYSPLLHPKCLIPSAQSEPSYDDLRQRMGSLHVDGLLQDERLRSGANCCPSLSWFHIFFGMQGRRDLIPTIITLARA